jgi:hypothetical protein
VGSELGSGHHGVRADLLRKVLGEADEEARGRRSSRRRDDQDRRESGNQRDASEQFDPFETSVRARE